VLLERVLTLEALVTLALQADEPEAEAREPEPELSQKWRVLQKMP